MPDLIKEQFVVCTLRYSDNLGDGVIADNVEYLLAQLAPGAPIHHLDMAGRHGYTVDIAARSKLKSVFLRLPDFLKPVAFLASWWSSKKAALRRQIAVLPDRPYLIFGGGQILNDVALNFPCKFNLVVHGSGYKFKKIALHAVGASTNWSLAARKLFSRSLASPRVAYISVRDRHSAGALTSYLPGLCVHETVDPAVWSAVTYGLPARVARQSKHWVGVGIADPSELATQAESASFFRRDAFREFWVDLLQNLSENGLHPVVFSNGSAEDDRFLKEVTSAFERRYPGTAVSRLPRAASPAELCSQIHSFDAVVAHRLHANIVAFALAVPSVALVWDRKVREFATVSRREPWCIEGVPTVADVGALVASALAQGVDLTHLRALQARCKEQMSTMLEILRR